MSTTHQLESRTAIVTGASRGIGAAIARQLASDGAAVIVNYASSEVAAASVVREIESAGGRARAVQADVSAPGGARLLFDRAEDQFGPVSIVVNNAGYAIRKPLAELLAEDFDRVIAVNLKGVFATMAESARRMPDGGSIVNISASFHGAPIPGYSIYAASKMAIEKLTEVAAAELGPRKIRVNAVRPGPTNTDLFNQGKTDEMRAMFAKRHALGRIGEPDDIAAAVRWLVSDGAAWVTGQSIGTNGGYW